MKVLFFIESLQSGGKERRLVELIKSLSADEIINIELVLTKTDIHYKEVLELPIKVHFTPRGRLKKDPRVFLKFFKIARKFRPDIINVWGNMAAVYAIPSKILLGIPMINNQVTDAPPKVGNSLLGHKLTFRFSDRVISNTEAGLRAYSAPMDKSGVIYNGFNFERIAHLKSIDEVRDEFDISTQYVVGMVASFSHLKDYESYIKAANEILSKNYDVTFLCVGSGDDTPYKAMVEEKHKKKVLFLGRQSNVERIMNICDIGVLMSSPVHGEGISNTLLEFCALEKPTIAVFGGGTAELIVNNSSGFLIPLKAVDQLTDRLEILLQDADKRAAFGKKAKERVVNEFSMEKMITNFMDEYTNFKTKNKS